MSEFLSPLRAEYYPGDTGDWVLLEPLVYASDVAGRTITVPAGFTTDFASTPRIPVIYEALGNIGVRAAVVHDYLYTSGRESRSMSDKVFREAAAVTGVSWWQRWAMWAGVRIGGGRRYTRDPGGSPVTDPDAVPAAIGNVLY